MPKVGMSFEESRKALLKSVQKKSGNEGERVTLHFDNDDVPKFIKALQQSEARSRKTRLIVK